MNLVYIDDSLYESRDNYRDELKVNEMPENAKEYYYLLYSYYNQMFIKFLIKNTNIKNVDESIEKSSLKFGIINEEEKDFYQTLSIDFKYLYLRNNLYLYRLTEEENNFLKKCLLNDKDDLDKEIEEFIKLTFRKVIYEDVQSNENINVNFGPRESNRFAPKDSLVLGVRYNSKENGLDGKEWYENYKRQQEFLNTALVDLSKNISDNLKCNCRIFEYDEYSIKKKVSDISSPNDNFSLK